MFLTLKATLFIIVPSLPRKIDFIWLFATKFDVITFLCNLNLELEATEEKPNIPITGKKIPRNSPCPCGSGKKYKHCCGVL